MVISTLWKTTKDNEACLSPFIDDDCCVLPGMLAGVVGIHAKPKKDCHSSGHPHHATVWAKHQHHHTDKFSEQLCTQKPRTSQCNIPRTPGTSYAFLCLAISLKHIDTAIHGEIRDPTLRPPGSAQSAVRAWPGNTVWWHGVTRSSAGSARPSTWCKEAPPGHVVVPSQHVRLETPKNLKHGNNLDTARFEDELRRFKGKPTTLLIQFSFCHRFTSWPYFIQDFYQVQQKPLFWYRCCVAIQSSSVCKSHMERTHAGSTIWSKPPKSLLSPSTSSPAHIRWCTPLAPHRFYSSIHFRAALWEMNGSFNVWNESHFSPDLHDRLHLSISITQDHWEPISQPLIFSLGIQT